MEVNPRSLRPRADSTELMRSKLGVCQWFHYQAYEDVERCVSLLRELGIRHLRTGISWADYHRPGGARWYTWQMRALAEFEVLLSIWHTPPSLAEGGCCASPPRRLEEYAGFVGYMIEQFGDHFTDLELWNEPNNRLKWDFARFDPEWRKFSAMIAGAARCAKSYFTQDDRRRRVVLGGMIPVDPAWLRLIDGHGALADVDVVAIHAFPEMWWKDAPNWDWYRDWHGWRAKIDLIAGHCGGRPVWVSETGLATWDLPVGRRGREGLQVERLRAAAAAPAERVYWYSLVDLDPARPAIEGFHVDENEYHLGLVTWEGRKKPAWYEMKRLLSAERRPLVRQRESLPLPRVRDQGVARQGVYPPVIGGEQ